jgi:hypothetical protein
MPPKIIQTISFNFHTILNKLDTAMPLKKLTVVGNFTHNEFDQNKFGAYKPNTRPKIYVGIAEINNVNKFNSKGKTKTINRKDNLVNGIIQRKEFQH